MQLPIRTRLTLISAGLMAVVLAGLGAFLYTRLEATLIEAVDTGLRSRASVLVLRLAEGGGVSDGGLSEGDEAFAQIIGSDGTVLDSSSGIATPLLTPDALEPVDGVEFFERSVETSEEQVIARLLATRTPSGDVLVVGASLEDQHEALAGLRSLLAVGIPAAVALAAAVGWVVAGGALRPVEQLRREADAISASEPGRRLAVPATGDELSRMAESLNQMLARLERAVEQERRFVADASHELRTPLANLRAELDVALRRARTAEELTAALRSVREETDRLGRLAEDLLVLARLGEGGLHLRREETDVAHLAAETVESFAGRAESLGVELTADGGAATAMVDPVRLRQAIGNLIDNAVRHARSGVSVSTRSTESGVEIVVADDGAGFPPAFADRIGQGFSRPDAARERGSGGTGLGLAIVQAVVDAHGGTMRADTAPRGGATVTIAIPVNA